MFCHICKHLLFWGDFCRIVIGPGTKTCHVTFLELHVELKNITCVFRNAFWDFFVDVQEGWCSVTFAKQLPFCGELFRIVIGPEAGTRHVTFLELHVELKNPTCIFRNAFWDFVVGVQEGWCFVTFANICHFGGIFSGSLLVRGQRHVT